MATPEELKQNLKEIREEFIILDDTLSSLGSTIANSINTQINSLDSGTQRVAKSFSKDLTKAIDMLNKMATIINDNIQLGYS